MLAIAYITHNPVLNSLVMNVHKSIWTVLFLLICSSFAVAQSPDTDHVWELINQRQFEDLKTYLDEHQQYFLESGDKERKALYHFGKSQYYSSIHDLRSEFHHTSEARQFIDDIDNEELTARVLHNYVVNLFQTYQWENLLEKQQRTIDAYKKYLPEDAPQIGQMYGNMGNYLTASGNYEDGLEAFQKSREILESHFGSEHPSMVMYYSNVSIVYYGLGDIERSVRYKRYASELGMEVFPESHPHQTLAALNYANGLITNNQLEEAWRVLDMVEEIRSRHFPENHPEMVRLYFNRANVLRRQGFYEEAIPFLEKNIEILSEYELNPRLELQNLELLARVHMHNGSYDQAAETFALLRENSNHSNNPVFLSSRLFEAENNLRRGNYELALSQAQDVLQVINPDFDPSEPNSVDMGQITSPRNAFPLFERIGDIYAHPNNPDRDLNIAADMYDRSIDVSWNMREYALDEESALYWSETITDIFFRAIDVQYELYQETGAVRHIKRAINLLQNSKATALFRSSSFAQGGDIGNVPEHIFDREHELRSALSQAEVLMNRNMTAGAEGEEISNARDAYLKASIALSEFLDDLRYDYPEYYSIRYRPIEFSLDDIRAYAGESKTIIEYAVNESGSQAFIVAINSDDILFEKVDLQDDFFEKLVDYRNMLSSAALVRRTPMQNFKVLSREFYNQLIKPVAENMDIREELVILPDAALHILPFETLLTAESESSALSEQPFLLIDHAIKYHYSTSLLLLTERSPGIKEKMTAGIFAPVFQETQLALSDRTGEQQLPISSLPHSEVEAEKVAELLHGKGLNVTSMLNQYASIPQGNEGFNYDILHLATHGYFNSEFPSLSALAFLNSETGEPELLYSGQVFNMNINSDLVVLSGCDTGFGQIRRAEGILSLNRAFLAAGANNILYTLWQISDQHTVTLMENFYSGVVAGLSYEQALRDAKLAMLDDEVSSLPMYWAAFMLLGS